MKRNGQPKSRKAYVMGSFVLSLVASASGKKSKKKVFVQSTNAITKYTTAKQEYDGQFTKQSKANPKVCRVS